MVQLSFHCGAILMTITELSARDLHIIIPLVRAMLDEVKEPGFKENYFNNAWTLAMVEGKSSIFVMGEMADPCGVCGATLCKNTFTGQLVAYLVFEYVKHGYRGKHGIRLFRRFNEWAEQRGAKVAAAGHSHNLLTDNHSAMVARYGYETKETIYARRIG